MHVHLSLSHTRHTQAPQTGQRRHLPPGGRGVRRDGERVALPLRSHQAGTTPLSAHAWCMHASAALFGRRTPHTNSPPPTTTNIANAIGRRRGQGLLVGRRQAVLAGGEGHRGVLPGIWGYVCLFGHCRGRRQTADTCLPSTHTHSLTDRPGQSIKPIQSIDDGRQQGSCCVTSPSGRSSSPCTSARRRGSTAGCPPAPHWLRGCRATIWTRGRCETGSWSLDGRTDPTGDACSHDQHEPLPPRPPSPHRHQKHPQTQRRDRRAWRAPSPARSPRGSPRPSTCSRRGCRYIY